MKKCKCAYCGHCKRHHKHVGVHVWGWCTRVNCPCEVFI